MKQGTYKKLLLSLFGVLLIFGALFSVSKKDTVSAQAACKVENARFSPASINGEVDEKFMDKWYTEDNPPKFSIIASTTNCSGKNISVEIVEEDSTGNNTVKVGKTAKDSFYTDNGSVGPSILSAKNSSTITFNFQAGNSFCDNEYGPDCDLHFNIYADNTKIYNSVENDKNRAQGGSLDYDEGGDDRNFIFTASTEEDGDKLGTIWYYKLADGKYKPAKNGSGTTEAECRSEAEASNVSFKPVNCTDSPELGDIVTGALNGITSAVPECGISNIPACVTTVIYYLIFVPISFLAGLAGMLFDFLFEFSISSEIYGGGGAQIGFLKVAWTFLRDIANLGFILTLLFISIKQIISPVSYDAKKQIPKIIIIALVINFSYFFGTVIIDTTNVLARFLFTNDIICVNSGSGECEGTISEAVVSAFDPQTIVDRSSGPFLEATGKEELSVSMYAIILIMSIWCSWLMFKTFFKAATLFLGRIAQLWVLLVLSPLAFINTILPESMKIPKVAKTPQSWASEFFKNAFIAPLFMFFMYLILLMVSGFDFVASIYETKETSGFIVVILLILPFLIITKIMNAAVEYTTEQAGSIANMFTSTINKAVGAVGTVAAIGLSAGGAAVFGKAGKALANSNWTRDWMSRRNSTEGTFSNSNVFGRQANRLINNTKASIGSIAQSKGAQAQSSSYDISKGRVGSFAKDVGFNLAEGDNYLKKLGLAGIAKRSNYDTREKDKDEKLQGRIDRLTSSKERFDKMNEKFEEEWDKEKSSRWEAEYAKIRKDYADAGITDIPTEEIEAKKKAFLKNEDDKNKDSFKKEYESKNGTLDADKATAQRQRAFTQGIQNTVSMNAESSVADSAVRAGGGAVAGAGMLAGAAASNPFVATAGLAGATVLGASAISERLKGRSAEKRFIKKFEKDKKKAEEKELPTLEAEYSGLDSTIKTTEGFVKTMSKKLEKEFHRAIESALAGGLADGYNEALKKSKEFQKFAGERNIETDFESIVNDLKNTDNLDEKDKKERLAKIRKMASETNAELTDKLVSLDDDAEQIQNEIEDYLNRSGTGKKDDEYKEKQRRLDEIRRKQRSLTKPYQTMNTERVARERKEELEAKKKMKDEKIKELKNKFAI